MNLGGLNFDDRLAKKPVGLTPAGEFITLEDVAAMPALGLGSAFALDLDSQIKLAVERYQYEPELKLAVLGMGVFTRDEIVEAMQAQTPLGEQAVRAEMGYVNTLLATLTGREAVAEWPEEPKAIPPKWPDSKKVGRWIWIKIQHRVVACENSTDYVTGPFAAYRIKNVHPVFAARGFQVVSLEGVDDNRANFVPAAKYPVAVYLTGIGHGAYDLYTGHMGDRILWVGHYDAAEVKNKSAHFLSCQTATTLGPDTVAKGAKSYTGYTENFVLTWDDASTPAVNEFELFARCDSTYDLRMACGATAQAAYDATKAAFTAAMACVPGSAAASWLQWDRDHLRLCGDPTSKIEPYTWIKIRVPLVRPLEELLVQTEGLLAE